MSMEDHFKLYLEGKYELFLIEHEKNDSKQNNSLLIGLDSLFKAGYYFKVNSEADSLLKVSEISQQNIVKILLLKCENYFYFNNSVSGNRTIEKIESILNSNVNLKLKLDNFVVFRIFLMKHLFQRKIEKEDQIEKFITDLLASMEIESQEETKLILSEYYLKIGTLARKLFKLNVANRLNKLNFVG
jgi:hypothetical protein